MTRQDVHPERVVPAAGFSVREFARTAHGSHRASLDLDAYRDAPLDPGTVEMIDLLARLEHGALAYLRSVLVTPTHKDARVTAFLVTWAFEKYWVADALEQIVATHPAPASTGRGIPTLRRARLAIAERIEPITESVVTNLIGDDVIAVHTAAGAIDEWITQAAYARLRDSSDHSGFVRTLDRLLAVKRPHGDFLSADAGDRLAASPRAAKLARRRLRRMAWPLGSATEPPVLVARLLGDVVPGPDLALIDSRVDALPGLADLHLASTAARTAGKAATR